MGATFEYTINAVDELLTIAKYVVTKCTGLSRSIVYVNNDLVFVMHVAVIYFMFLFCICAATALVTIVIQYMYLRSESKPVTAMSTWVSRDISNLSTP